MGSCWSKDDETYAILLESPVIEKLKTGTLFVHGKHDGRTYFFSVEPKACQTKNAKVIKVFYGDMVQTGVHVFNLKRVTKVQRP